MKLGIDAVDQLGRTALHVAVSSGELKLATPLLRARATTALRSSDGATVLQLAIEQADLPLASLLLQVGAEKDLSTAEGIPLLVLAAERSVPIALALVQVLSMFEPAGLDSAPERRSQGLARGLARC